MWRHQHGYPWLFPATLFSRLLLQSYITYRHGAAVCSFDLVVLPLLIHV